MRLLRLSLRAAARSQGLLPPVLSEPPEAPPELALLLELWFPPVAVAEPVAVPVVWAEVAAVGAVVWLG